MTRGAEGCDEAEGYDEKVPADWRALLALLLSSTITAAQSYSAPAGIRPALRRPGASILPGGRIISSLGDELVTGPGAFGLVVSPSGKTVVTSNSGPGRNSLTVMERDKSSRWDVRQLLARSSNIPTDSDSSEWRSVFMGLAFANEHSVYASEGNSGRVSLLDWNADRRRTIDLNQNGFDDSYTGDLALDAERGLLYVVDQANFRVAIIDTRTRRITASVRVGRLPFALALSPDRQKLYVTNLGTFQYQVIPGADPKQARATGLSFPAFGFPSPEAAAGVERQTERGSIQVPGLGDPGAPESNSVAVIDVSNPAAAKVVAFVRTGNSPSGVVAAQDRIFVSDSGSDAITIIDAKTNQVEGGIPIRIPGLEQARGVLPIGLAYHEKSGWLLVAEAGINAVAVIDTRQKQVLGHLPVAVFPTRIVIQDDTVFVANARGHGKGPNSLGSQRMLPASQLRQGSVSVFPLPAAADLPAQTAFVMEANGFLPHPEAPRPLPSGIRHVVLIVKENRSYDEILGDIPRASNGAALGSPEIARFGSRGYVDGKRSRFSLKDVNITPNHHAMAGRWAFSDNFYTDSDFSAGGHHWLVGVYPNAWTESSLMAAWSDQEKDFRLGEAPGRLSFAGFASSVLPEELGEAGSIWHHLARHGVSFYNFGEGFELPGAVETKDLEPTGARFLTNVPMPQPLYDNTSRQYPGFNMNISDQYRASQFIREMDEKYVRGGVELPGFLFIHLPNDYMARERPDDGYPYEASFVSDNDRALGRILEYLSTTKWWPEMAVFVTEADAQGGMDHVDAHRTVLLSAGPWARKNYVSHVNTSFPGLLKTIFRLLHVPPMTLFDAAASDLADCFAARPDPAPYKALDVDPRIFDPAAARDAPTSAPPKHW